MKHKKYNIAKSEWLTRALGSTEPLERLIEFTRDDMICATDDLERRFGECDM